MTDREQAPRIAALRALEERFDHDRRARLLHDHAAPAYGERRADPPRHRGHQHAEGHHVSPHGRTQRIREAFAALWRKTRGAPRRRLLRKVLF